MPGRIAFGGPIGSRGPVAVLHVAVGGVVRRVGGSGEETGRRLAARHGTRHERSREQACQEQQAQYRATGSGPHSEHGPMDDAQASQRQRGMASKSPGARAFGPMDDRNEWPVSGANEVLSRNRGARPDAKAPPTVKSCGASVYPVGETGFEPATPASRTQCSTGLSYSPKSNLDNSSCCDGRGGIRTHEGFHPTRFPIVLLKPLGHPSSDPAVHSAERVGFEPTRAFRARRFSKPLP